MADRPRAYGDNLLPLTREAFLSRPQAEDTPCCALIAVLASYVLLTSGANLSVIKNGVFEQAISAGEKQYREVTAPYATGMKGKYRGRGVWILSEDALDEMKLHGNKVFHTIKTFTGHHFKGTLPAAVKEAFDVVSAAGGEQIDSPLYGKSTDFRPIEFCHLLPAMYNMAELAAEMKTPLAANIDFANHTTCFVCYYVDEETTYYYIFDSHRCISGPQEYKPRFAAIWAGDASLSLTIGKYESWVKPHVYNHDLSELEMLSTSAVPDSLYTMEVYQLVKKPDSSSSSSSPSSTSAKITQSPPPRVLSPASFRPVTPPAVSALEQGAEAYFSSRQASAAAAVAAPASVTTTPTVPIEASILPTPITTTVASATVSTRADALMPQPQPQPAQPQTAGGPMISFDFTDTAPTTPTTASVEKKEPPTTRTAAPTPSPASLPTEPLSSLGSQPPPALPKKR